MKNTYIQLLCALHNIAQTVAAADSLFANFDPKAMTQKSHRTAKSGVSLLLWVPWAIAEGLNQKANMQLGTRKAIVMLRQSMNIHINAEGVVMHVQESHRLEEHWAWCWLLNKPVSLSHLVVTTAALEETTLQCPVLAP